MAKIKRRNPSRSSSGRRPHPSPSQHQRPYPPRPPTSRVRKPAPRTNPPPSPTNPRRHTSPDSQSTVSTSSKATALPFPRDDPILLVGEGDFSFALSLHATHRCSALTATTLLSADELATTHAPTGPANAASLADAGYTVLYGVDATVLGKPGVPNGAALRRKRFATIIFNFPHVGGKSTDVARQARANQELLRGFFEGAKRLLTEGNGRLVVSTWDGEAYDAWGLKALARENGLGVERSRAFDWGLWKGYRHVRNSGKEIVDNGKAWSSERRARMWVLRTREELTMAEKRRSRTTNDSDDAGDD